MKFYFQFEHQVLSKKILKLENGFNFMMYSESLARLPSALKVFISMMTLFCTLIPSESCKKLSLKYNTKRQIANFSLTKGILNFLTRVNFEFARHSDIATRHKAQL